MQSIQNIALDKLRFGHEFPGASINARQAGRTANIEQLAASIAVEGVLNSLHAFQDPDAEKKGVHYVDDGNRRLAALLLLVKQKKIAKDALIPVVNFTGDNHKDALRKSLAAAQHAVPVHPVDQFETFAALLDDGADPEKIAARYALPVKIVKQRLALGKLSPVIRDAWRKGKIDADAAQAYASTAHHGAQEKLFKRGGWQSNRAHQIRHELIGSAQENQRLLKFVGDVAYKAVGGKLIEDLFGEKEGAKIVDFGLLERLAAEKLKAEGAVFVKKGWGWAAAVSDLPSGAQHMWPRKSSPTADEKKKLGVILDISYGGALETRTGVIKPGVKGIKPSDGSKLAKAAKKKPEGAISDTLAQRLSEALSFGASDALADDKPELALAFVLAALNSFDGPVSIHEHGLAENKRDKFGRGNKEAKFRDQLPIFLKLSLKDKLAALARIAGRSLDMQTRSAQRLPLADKDNWSVLSRMDGKRLSAAICAKFDAEDYFKSVSGAMRLQAIREMAHDQEPAVAKMKKAGQITSCVAIFKKSPAWLPPELRTIHYAGPALKIAKKKTAKKAKR